MLLVVADAGPIRYLVQIDQIGVLSLLFEEIILPEIVRNELQHTSAPQVVRNWIRKPPEWVKILPAPRGNDPALRTLDAGETAAIELGMFLKADLILMDDRKGVAAALLKGLKVTGTLGVLDLAAHRGLIQIGETVARLKATNFHCTQEMLDNLLAEHGANGKKS